jgi:hypothetical protein
MKVKGELTPPSLPVGTEKTHGIRRPDIQCPGQGVTSGQPVQLYVPWNVAASGRSVPIY